MPQIRVSKKSRDVLNQLSELSRIPVTKIVDEWTQALAQILDEISTSRISLMSTRHKNEGLVLTFVAELFVGSIPDVPDTMSDETVLKKKGVLNER